MPKLPFTHQSQAALVQRSSVVGPARATALGMGEAVLRGEVLLAVALASPAELVEVYARLMRPTAESAVRAERAGKVIPFRR